jgi:hypothetical protein
MELEFGGDGGLVPRIHRLIGGRHRNIGGNGGEQGWWVQVGATRRVSRNDAVGPNDLAKGLRDLIEGNPILRADLDGRHEATKFMGKQWSARSRRNCGERGDDVVDTSLQRCPATFIGAEKC